VTTQTPERTVHPSPDHVPVRAAARGLRSTSRRARAARRRPAVPPVERANGWLVAVAVLGAAVLFTVLAMNAFMGG